MNTVMTNIVFGDREEEDARAAWGPGKRVACFFLHECAASGVLCFVPSADARVGVLQRLDASSSSAGYRARIAAVPQRVVGFSHGQALMRARNQARRARKVPMEMERPSP